MCRVSRGRSNNPHYLVRPESWPVALATFVVLVLAAIVMITVGSDEGTTWLQVGGWVLFGLAVVGLFARAITIEVLAALAAGESPRNGCWRFAWAVLAATLVWSHPDAVAEVPF